MKKVQNYYIYIKKVMNNRSDCLLKNNYEIQLSQCLCYNKSSWTYKAINKHTNKHFTIKTFYAQQKLHKTIQKILIEARYLIKSNNKQHDCEHCQLVQWSKLNNIICVARPFIYGDNIHDSILKNSQSIFKIIDLSYFLNKYHELIFKSFSTNFFPTLKSIYLNGDHFEQNYTCFTNILFLKENILISKNQYNEIYPYLNSTILTKNQKQRQNFLKVQCKIRSLMIFLISYMTGKKLDFLQLQKIPEIIDIKNDKIFKIQEQVKRKWDHFLNTKQNKQIFQQYGRVLKKNRQYFTTYFQKVLVKEEEIEESELVNQKFLNYFQFIQKNNKIQYKIIDKYEDAQKKAQINQKLDKVMKFLQNYMQKKQYCRFDEDHSDQSCKTFFQRQLKLNSDLLNCFKKWHNFCLVDLKHQTQQIKLGKEKIIQKINEFIISEQFKGLQKQNQKSKKIIEKDIYIVKNVLVNSGNQQISKRKQNAKQNKKKYFKLAMQKGLLNTTQSKFINAYCHQNTSVNYKINEGNSFNQHEIDQQSFQNKKINDSRSTDCDSKSTILSNLSQI